MYVLELLWTFSETLFVLDYHTSIVLPDAILFFFPLSRKDQSFEENDNLPLLLDGLGEFSVGPEYVS